MISCSLRHTLGTMKFQSFLSHLMMVTMVTAQPSEFDCRRNGQDCGAGNTCNPANGQCTCSSNVGYRCQIDPSHPDADCSLVCSSLYCYPNLDCLCSKDEYGYECEYQRFQHMCSYEGKMVINANIVGATELFVMDGNYKCSLDGTGNEIPLDWEGPARVVNTPTDADCGNAVVTANADSTSKTCITAYVLFQTGYVTSRDMKVTYCCSGTTVEDVEVREMDIDSSDIAVNIDQSPGGSSDVIFYLYDDTGNYIPSSAEVTIGQKVQVQFRLDSDADYVATQPIKCTLQDDLSSPTASIELVENLCATYQLNSELTFDPTTGNYDLDFSVVKFLTSDIAYLVCDLRLCVVEDNCDNSLICMRRKKRDVSSNTTEVVRQVVTEIKVKDPFQKKVEMEADVAVTRPTNINLTASTIGLGVAVLILLAVCLILGLCLINKRRLPAPNDAKDKPADKKHSSMFCPL